jgi:membrane associated rhomboid family serine protease
MAIETRHGSSHFLKLWMLGALMGGLTMAAF